MKLSILVFAMASILLSNEVKAASASMEESSTFRCDRGLVSIKDTFHEVREKCGEPTSFSNGQWVYDFGSYSFIYIIRFRDSKVHKIINTGNYGLK